MRRWVFLAALFALGLAAATFATRGSSRAADGTLSASVGPGFSISLTQNGSAVTNLAPGTYTIDVSDMATVHNFHLSGPGVDEKTSVTGTGSTSWTVTFSAGSYHFQCDAHPTSLFGDFTVGQGGTTTTAPPTTTLPPTTTATGTTGTTTTSTTGTTTATPTVATTVVAETTATVQTTTDVTATTAGRRAAVAARVAAVRATRARVVVTVKVTEPGRATVDLLDRRGARRAHLVAAVRGTTRLALRPKHRLSPGRYLLRLRVSAGGRTVVVTRLLRVA